MSQPYISGGNIYPCRFLILSDSFLVTQSGAAPAFQICGVSQYWTKLAPGTAFDAGATAVSGGYIAVAGDPVPMVQDPCDAMIETGLPVTAGDPLKPDANGRAVPATSGTYYGAVAKETAAASGVRIRCTVVFNNYKV